jgi:GWxTD domain-containing protein
MKTARRHRRRLVVLLAALLALGSLVLVAPGADAKGKKEVERQQLERLTPEQRAWLEEVALLITKEERATFLAIEKDYQRDAFIERFWKIRDTYPETGRNEFKDRWDSRMREVRSLIGDPSDDRAVVLLLNGFPDGQVDIRCSGFYPAEVWYYERAETLGYEVLLLFYQRWGSSRYTLWNPMGGLGGLVRQADASIAQPNDINSIINSCPYEQASALRAAIRFASQGGAMGFAAVDAGLRRLPRPAAEPHDRPGCRIGAPGSGRCRRVRRSPVVQLFSHRRGATRPQAVRQLPLPFQLAGRGDHRREDTDGLRALPPTRRLSAGTAARGPQRRGLLRPTGEARGATHRGCAGHRARG